MKHEIANPATQICEDTPSERTSEPGAADELKVTKQYTVSHIKWRL
ncbi:MAG: hypothetical protein HRF47_01645 [Chloroflexota bacterium]